MPTRLIRLFLLAASLSFTGAAVVALSGSGLVGVPTAANVATLHTNAPMEGLSTTLMPPVLVHPEVEVPTLATVTVRLTRADVANVPASTTKAAATVSMPLLARRSTAGLMSSDGFDMPYYSFGKTLRHVSKE